MPFYNFKCPDCQFELEKLMKVAEMDEPQVCPCCEVRMERQVTAPGGFSYRGCSFSASSDKKR